MPITPDTKDWTWVIERPCGECGYDASALTPEQVADRIRENAAAWPAVLARSDARDRPRDDTWSPLEYAAHVRDVLRLYRERLHLMIETDDPLYPNWDQDATALAERYSEQDPAMVGRELGDAAAALAADFDTVSGDQWQRPGRRSDGVSFTVATFALYFIHDPIHHLWDVRG
ncbi:DinB family protein [Glaciihabitans tibetensis]|uniref:DinB family protein n=1 Tax=Glaciihabitans tibetensis TaxID=1266600 RepID=A0A2T0VCV7_9MICO|nr:DinB family protein [Glaciihabitans tibetensis]PRY68019.1 DinB family protein [Glaciihabitans tibetensis]